MLVTRLSTQLRRVSKSWRRAWYAPLPSPSLLPLPLSSPPDCPSFSLNHLHSSSDHLVLASCNPTFSLCRKSTPTTRTRLSCTLLRSMRALSSSTTAPWRRNCSINPKRISRSTLPLFLSPPLSSPRPLLFFLLPRPPPLASSFLSLLPPI